jgi:CubicO group peptidase (beta-lactamase class C family)
VPVGEQAGEQRALALFRILGAPLAARRAFVEANFTDASLQRRGVDGMAAYLGEIHAMFGDATPKDVRGLGDRVEFDLVNAAGDPVTFTVAISAPPESKLRGFRIATDDAASDAPVAQVAEAALPKAIADAVAAEVAEGFSGAVLVAKAGRPVFAKAYGDADRAAHRPNTLDTPFGLASNNKMMTAVLVMQLVEQGKLRLDDTVGKYLPDWPQADVRDKVTIEHLLTHTSGLGEYWNDAFRARADSLDTAAEFAALFHDDKPAAEPGKTFKYSNNGYVLLGLIAEKVTGKDYYDLVRERIYEPAGMTHTAHYLRTDPRSGVAIGYDDAGKPATGAMSLRGSPAGGGYSSANDQLRFAMALEGGKLVGKDTLARITTGHVPMGPDMAYGYGFGVVDGKEKHYGHEGGAPGTSASFTVYPASGYVIVVLSNRSRGAGDLARGIGRLVAARTP